MIRLLLHDSLTTANLAEPLRLGWVDQQIDVAFDTNLQAGSVGPDDFALVPSPEFSLLASTHRILPEVAVIDTQSSAIAMRTPGRPDEIESSSIVLYHVSATAELLARALLWPFFGIAADAWLEEPAAGAQVTIVEGTTALQEPESGYSLDLGRSWFVMTGMPLVTHVLAAPVITSEDERNLVTGLLRQSRAESQNRRRELRQIFDRLYEIERERLVSYLAGQQYSLDSVAREALVALNVRGAGGSRYLPLTRPPFAGDDPE